MRARGLPQRALRVFPDLDAPVRARMRVNALTEASAQRYIKPSATGKPIAELLVAEIIEAHEHGWIVVDPIQAGAMLIRKKAG